VLCIKDVFDNNVNTWQLARFRSQSDYASFAERCRSGLMIVRINFRKLELRPAAASREN
jgi:hypothetical protein